MRRALLGLIALATLALGACEPTVGGASAPAAFADPRRLPAIDDSTFGALVVGLSEPGAYFDTDNLISNEASYLHVVGGLQRRGVRGGAYIGVGPAQNFSYMAAIRPALAFVVDIRRDNLLQHLWFKALFEASTSRLDYLCLMVARACGGPSDGLDIGELVRRVDAAQPVAPPDSVVARVVDAAASFGVPLDAADSASIRSIHARFAAAGLDLRFNTHGQAPRPYYPRLRGLLLERDLEGRQSNYLASEDAYRFVRELERENRVIPVVGDLAGEHALRAIGTELRARDVGVSAVYTSNVEFYLFQDGTFGGFVRNLEALPVNQKSVIIRAYFNRFRPIPGGVAGYASTQLLQPIPSLLSEWREGGVRGYLDVIGGSQAGS